MPRVVLALALSCLCLVSCRGRSGESARKEPTAGQVGAALAPSLPDDEAGRLIGRAIAAAGGWEIWRRYRDASFISTLTMFDPAGNALSDSIFLHQMPLHRGMKVRLESIGLADGVVFGFDGENEWMLHDGRAVTEPTRTAFTRFHALSSAYWFSLPFILGELPCELTYLGAEDDNGTKLEKVRVGYADSVPVPFDWLVLYFDAATAKLERVHVHALAEFLQHSLWLGVWRDERRVDGISVARHRAFFPADAAGEIVGGMAAEQLVEQAHFDQGLAPESFERPGTAPGLTAEIES